ncbi:MAG: hypothetical protein AAF298_06490 [Cyanobacteria bacterium P01_A01_bin.40]
MTLQRKISPRSRAILDALMVAMSETAEIEVTTYIDSSDLDQIEQSSSTSRFHTQISLMKGTVDHEIDLKLIDNPAYRELQRWHIEQVHRTQDSIVENLISLEKMRRILL